MAEPLPYRDFQYPLNVFMHILTLEEGDVRDLHYGLFERGDESIAEAQERSTALLLTQLPPPPARILDAGAGLGTTLARLVQLGYRAEGVTPDEAQLNVLRARHGDALPVHLSPFEDFRGGPYDAIVFQESSQYIDAAALFSRAAILSGRVVVLDEFAMRPEGELHRFEDFVAAAKEQRFTLQFQTDVSQQAAPTTQYFLDRFARYRQVLIGDLGLSSQQVDDLIESGNRYRDFYRNGTYAYFLLRFERGDRISTA